MKSALLVAAIGLLVGANSLVESSGYGQQYPENSYGGAGGYSSNGYDSSYGYERPRVNLGISLKVPAMKINLGRMNMPRISIRAKIKQSNHPKVIQVPEMHIDTQSKIPGPQGSMHDNGHYSYGGSSGASYGSSSSSYGNSGSSSSSYEAPSSGYSSPSYSSSPSSSYGNSASSSSSYEAPSNGYSSPSYSSGPSSSYGNSASSSPASESSSGQGYSSSGASYGSEPSYSSQGGYEAPSSYKAPSSYTPPSTGGGYEPTNYAPSSYSQAAPSSYEPTGVSFPSYNEPMPSYSSYEAPTGQQASYSMTQNTGQRNQYGGTPNAYSQAATGVYPPRQSYSPRPYAPAPAAQPKPSAPSYPSSNSYAPAPTSYQPAPSQYGPSQYSYQAQEASSNSYKSSPASSSYSSPSYEQPSSSYGGYQPLEPGHTLLTATNDNYDGQTQLTVASNPPKESYPSGSSYGQQYNSPSSYQPSSYNNNEQASYSASQPTFDDYAAPSYNQGNYGARTSLSAPRNAGYMEPHKAY